MTMQIFVKSAEIKLMETLGEIGAEAAGWRALHFHLSDLLDDYKSEYQIQIAINLIHDLLKNDNGGIFPLIDHSIMVLCYGLEQNIQDKLIFQLRYLYMDDPLAYNDAGQENPYFCTLYNLSTQWQEFFDACSHCMSNFARKRPPGEWAHEKWPSGEAPAPESKFPVIEKSDKQRPGWTDSVPGGEKAAFSASGLVRIEHDLARADLHKLLRRQPVCAVLPDMTVRRVFDEMYVHINHLRQALRSNVDFLSNRWLFKYMTRTLDARMIGLIHQNPKRYLDSPISINLNAETLLSAHFDEFDAVIKPDARVSIVIEIPVVDAFADMTAFVLARSKVQKLGYRVCLDGLTVASFLCVSREQLGVDLVKIQWNADMQTDLGSKENFALMEAVLATGSNRVILCRCDNRNAIEYGHGLGISLFQGRYLDTLLNPTAKLVN